MRLMISGGGTGGHTSPAVAILQELQRRDPRLVVQWVGARGKIEQRVSANAGVAFRSLRVRPWPRSNVAKKLWTALALAVAVVRSAVLLLRFRPDVVLGVGGYVSVPLVWTAQRIGILTVLHEQNKRMGLANQLLARRADRVFLSYENTQGAFEPGRARLVGNPVRNEFLRPPLREHACVEFGLDPNRRVVLVCGGSQGAQSINDAVAAMLPAAQTNEFQLIWMTGQNGVADARKRAEGAPVPVHVRAGSVEMAAACSAADLIVARAGASMTAEIAALGKPSVLVPYPHAAEGHQEDNARAFEAAGAAEVVFDRDFTSDVLLAKIRSLFNDSAALEAMAHAAAAFAKPAAGDMIAEDILDLVFKSKAD
jgi:UDP-N-acetylglucosamine--N-acetylmuramyl-(pentapeptide) pyrophosphoryl-undecaprenol N-acetylglucosamine transferase